MGDVITFTVTMTNHGPDKSTGTQGQDVLPAGLTFISSSGDGNYNAKTGKWTGNLNMANGQSHTLHITALVTTDGCFDNTATVIHQAQDDPNPANDSATVTVCASPPPGRADLAVTKTVNDPAPNVGQTVAFTVGVRNNGPSQATGVALDDALPTGLTLVSAAPSQGTFNSVDGEWTVGTLANGGSATLSLQAVVTDPNPETNTASISNSDVVDPNSGNDIASATVTPQQADLVVGKTVDNPTPNVGDTVHYTITAGNLGPNSATHVTLTDLLPSGLTFVSATPGQGTYNASNGVWTVGTLASGAMTTLTIAAVVVSPDPVTNTASITHSDQFDPDDGNDTASVVITPQQADLQVTKTVSNPTPNVGNTVTFTVTLTNNGPDTATNVAVTDLLPAGLTFVSAAPSQGSYASTTGVWTVGTMPVGPAQTLSVQATVTTPAQVTNAASVTHADQYDPDPTNNTDSVTVIPEQANLAVYKTVDNPTPNVGDTIHYKITLFNNGPDTATGVTVQDLLPPQVTFVAATASEGTDNPTSGLWTVGTMTVGTPQTLTITALVTTAGASANTVTITHSDDYDPDPSNNSYTASVDPLDADLALTKTVNDPTPNVGQQVTFTVGLANNGPDQATGVAVTDVLPAGLTFVSATASQGTYNSGTGLWSIGTVADGGTASLQVVATVTSPNPATNTATVSSSDQADADPGNNTASTTITPQQADLTVGKTVDNQTPNVGDTVTYNITLTNQGPDPATSVTLTDRLPAGLTFVSATPSQGTYDPITGVWTVGTVPDGVVENVAIQARVVSPGAETNTAAVSHSDQYDPNPSDNTASVTITPQQADLAITKTVDNQTPNVGDTVTFTITLTNRGPDTATNVTVTDPLTAGFSFVSATPDQGTYDTASGVWTVGSLTDGATATLAIAAVVAPNAKTNTATISHSDQFDPNMANNTATVAVDPLQAGLALTKTVNNTHPNVGDQVVFTVALVNHGPDQATDVTVLDSMPAGLTFVSAAPGQGTYDPGIGLWTVGTVASTASATLTITARVSSPGAHTNTASISHSDQYDPDPSNHTAAITVNATNPSTTTTPTTSPGNTVSPPAAAAQASETSAALPTTGANLITTLVMAAATIALGMVFLIPGRRRRESRTPNSYDR